MTRRNCRDDTSDFTPLGVAHSTAHQEEVAAEKKLEHLKKLIQALLVEVGAVGVMPTPAVECGFSFYEEVRRFEVSLIKQALARTGGHQRRAARLLGIKPTTLNNKIKFYRIDIRAASGAPETDARDSLSCDFL